MSQSEPASTPPSMLESLHEPADESQDRRQWRFLLRVVAIVLLLVLAYKVVRVGLHGMAAYNSAAQLRQVAGGDLDTGSLARIQPSLDQAARSTAALEREMRPFAPILRLARVVPGVGPTIAAMPDLLVAGKEYAFIANESLRLVTEEQAAQLEAPLQQLAAQTLAANPETFSILGERATIARQSLRRIDAAGLLPVAAEPVAQLQSISELVEAGLALSPQAADLLGFEGPRTYLVLVQNNHELRATGGFISAVGLVTLENGVPGDIELTDSYNISRDDVDHPWAPEPMQEHMGIDLVFIRDSNWSPDLPTSGNLARTLYNQDAGALVDGVITVDLRAVELLVGALGPLKVKGSEERVTGENLVDQIKLFWDRPIETGDTKESAGMQEWWKQRKDFMPALAQAALNRIRSGNYDPLAVADAAKAALDERAIQIWMANPDADAIFAAHGWNGALQPVDGADLLALVDTNMGYNKVDSVLERSLDYVVAWPDGEYQPALADVTITYRHPVEVPGHVCDQTPRYGDNYDAMIERCYFDYVRLYVPAGSELLDAEGLNPDSVEVSLGENGTAVFSGYFEMLPGTEHSVRFQYRLPANISPQDYRLAVRRQAGSGPLSVRAGVASQQLDTQITGGQFVWEPQAD